LVGGDPVHHGAEAAGQYDPATGRVVLFGGTPDGSTVLGDTWSITPSLTITPNSGPPGTHVSVHGFGYTPGATVLVVKYRTSHALPSAGPSSVICTATVAADSTFTCTGKTPEGAAADALGPHDVGAKDSAGLKSRTQFTLTCASTAGVLHQALAVNGVRVMCRYAGDPVVLW
jgi:hypothetical protein